MTDTQLALEICREIRAGNRQLCLPYTLERGEPGLTASKVGGTPYLPRGEAWPVDGAGKPMVFLAQVDCAGLAALPDFPHTGLLQFFTGADDVFGAEFDDLTRPDGFRVLYREEVDPAVTAADIPSPGEQSPWDSPLCGGPCRILFGPAREQDIPGEDCRFEQLFLRAWNSRRPEKPLKTLWDFYSLFPKGERDYDIFDGEAEAEQCRGPRHQLDGYPFFTQIDPRREEGRYSEFDTLLFQLDSDGQGPDDLVLWGDCGVGNFFISRQALRRRDFSRVMYTWDCT